MAEQIGKFMVAVGAIIENTATGKILMLKRTPKADYSGNIWEYITGRMDQFEEPEASLRREILEEAGIEVKIIKPVSVYHIFRGEKTAANELVGIIYWCQTSSGEVKISGEHIDYRWVTPAEAMVMVPKPSMQEDIKAYLKELGK